MAWMSMGLPLQLAGSIHETVTNVQGHTLCWIDRRRAGAILSPGRRKAPPPAQNCLDAAYARFLRRDVTRAPTGVRYQGLVRQLVRKS